MKKFSFMLGLVVTNTSTLFLCYLLMSTKPLTDDERYSFDANQVQQWYRQFMDNTSPLKNSSLEWMFLDDPVLSPKLALIMNSQRPITCTNSDTNSLLLINSTAYPVTTIIAITPTYNRLTQKLDLVSLCQTLMHVPNLLWIVIEDATNKSSLVHRILLRCSVKSVHLYTKTSKGSKKAHQRGVDQRNAGLNWVRIYCASICNNSCNGIVYFMDDDNKYDLRLFEEIRKTVKVSVFPVAFSGGLAFEGPICKEGKAVSWQAVWQSKERHIPVDMAAFAINVTFFTQNPQIRVGFQPGGKRRSKDGYMESDLIKHIGSSRKEIECRGVDNEVLVWHVKTSKPFLSYKNKYPSVEV